MANNNKIFMSMLREGRTFYQKCCENPDKMSKRCNRVQSMALKENIYEYVTVMLELFERMFHRGGVEAEDFKFTLAQCFEWYQK